MKDFKTMKPRDVEAYLREQVRKIFGDKVENASAIYSSRGYYYIEADLLDGRVISFKNFRKTQVPQIVKAMRALAE